MANSKQISLFDNCESVSLETTTNLVKVFNIKQNSQDNPALRKLKHNFNYRIKAIAKLKEDIEKMPKIFSFLNKKFNEIGKPVHDKLLESKLELIEVVDKVYGKKSLTENERDFICSFMANEINTISEMGHEVDLKFHKYFQLDKLAKSPESRGFVEEMMRNMMGMDVDLNDIMGEGKLSQEDFEKKYKKQLEEKEQEEREFEKNSEKHNQRNKSKGLKGENDLDLNRHFMKIYKNLAKKIHPDLEQNEEIRKQKEKLMQELAHAKDKKDLFQLISIKFKVGKIEENEEVIDENYLRLYADRLLEQKDELERDLYMLKEQSGLSSWLYQKFRAKHPKTTIKRMMSYRSELEEDIAQQKQLARSFKTVSGMKRFIRTSIEQEDRFYFYL